MHTHAHTFLCWYTHTHTFPCCYTHTHVLVATHTDRFPCCYNTHISLLLHTHTHTHISLLPHTHTCPCCYTYTHIFLLLHTHTHFFVATHMSLLLHTHTDLRKYVENYGNSVTCLCLYDKFPYTNKARFLMSKQGTLTHTSCPYLVRVYLRKHIEIMLCVCVRKCMTCA